MMGIDDWLQNSGDWLSIIVWVAAIVHLLTPVGLLAIVFGKGRPKVFLGVALVLGVFIALMWGLGAMGYMDEIARLTPRRAANPMHKASIEFSAATNLKSAFAFSLVPGVAFLTSIMRWKRLRDSPEPK